MVVGEEVVRSGRDTRRLRGGAWAHATETVLGRGRRIVRCYLTSLISSCRSASSAMVLEPTRVISSPSMRCIASHSTKQRADGAHRRQRFNNILHLHSTICRSYYRVHGTATAGTGSLSLPSAGAKHLCVPQSTALHSRQNRTRTT